MALSCCLRQPMRLLVCRLITGSLSDPPLTQLNCQEMACPVLHRFWQTITGLTQSPVLTFTSLHMSLLLVAYLGLSLCPMSVTPGCWFAWLQCGGVHVWSTNKYSTPKFIHSCAHKCSTQLASALGSSTPGVPLESGTWVIRQNPCTLIGDTSPKFPWYIWW